MVNDPMRYADTQNPPLEERTRPGATRPQARCPGCNTFAATFAIVMTTEGWRCDGCVSDAARRGENIIT